MSEYLKTCEAAARAGGEQLLLFRGKFAVRRKGPRDLVTEADFASQDAIRSVVESAFPDHEFLGEEDTSFADVGNAGSAVDEPGGAAGPGQPAGHRGESRFVWHVDPLDGTTNYVHGVAPFCVSVALAEAGEVVAGAIYDPLLDECFLAQRGGGAYLNGTPIAVSEVKNLSEALVIASFPPEIDPESDEIRGFLRVLAKAGSMRRTGSAALNLAYVAAGRFDAFWAVTINTWDVAAGALLVREAGGTVTAPDGRPFELQTASLAATASPPLHEQLIELLVGG
ncbi:MAG: inositol monophosphatase [Planctomycetota bacterium]|nr:MAG: inositol monophosphatase [Planctomycetota bacterium]REJ98532.1 MAG: inositol monophosphatase [Planctomycetota bacterium]REK29832.1 MAG: inositol monophosphatase [Planctomycetota bacterium]REK47997.1 MAG: inositol monophosphatase [Planctomycetota bacterium]